MADNWEDTYDSAQKRTEDTRRKMFSDALREKVPALDNSLIFMTPSEVLSAMNRNLIIKDYHARLKNYEPKEMEIALLFPDAERKPWTRGKTNALIYRNLYTALKSTGLEGKVAIFTLSPVLGVVPEEWYDAMPMYDSSGLQSFMVKRRGLPWNPEDFRKVIDISGGILMEFMERNHKRFGSWHAVFQVPSVHQRMLEVSLDRRPLPVWTHPSRKSLSDSYTHVKELLKGITDPERGKKK